MILWQEFAKTGCRIHMIIVHCNFYVFTGRICPKGSSAGIVFTHRPIFGFFCPARRMLLEGYRPTLISAV